MLLSESLLHSYDRAGYTLLAAEQLPQKPCTDQLTSCSGICSHMVHDTSGPTAGATTHLHVSLRDCVCDDLLHQLLLCCRQAAEHPLLLQADVYEESHRSPAEHGSNNQQLPGEKKSVVYCHWSFSTSPCA
jgi:hypothetical protein